MASFAWSDSSFGRGRGKREEARGKREDSLGLGSGADQGPWSTAASAPTVIRERWPTPTRRSSRATGKLWGENTPKRKTRGREDASYWERWRPRRHLTT